jgi:transcriptional regulator with XRE-family HTH domain
MVAASKLKPSTEGTLARQLKQVDESTYSGRLAARIRALRNERKMDVETLAKAVTKKGYKLGTSTLYHWENGTLQPNIDAMPAMAKALGVTLTELFPAK